VGPYRTPLNDDDESVDRPCAKLLVYPGDMHASEVSRLLGVSPARAVVVGERGPASRLGRVPVRKLNGWFLSAEEYVKSKDLRRYLDWLIERLLPSRDALLQLQSRPGVQMYVHCPWCARLGGGGPSLWPKQMRCLADLNLEYIIDFADCSEEGNGEAETED
jgi:hypothetical protein